MMKKIITLSALSLGVLFLAGCGQRPVGQAQPTVPATEVQKPTQQTVSGTMQPVAESQDLVGAVGNSKILTATNFEKIRTYLNGKDKNPDRRVATIAGFDVENYGPSNPSDQFSINGKDYDFLFSMQNKNMNISVMRMDFATGQRSAMFSEELMTKKEMQAAEDEVSMILEEIKK